MHSFTMLKSKYGSFSQSYYSNPISWFHWDLLHIHSGKLKLLFKNKNIDLTPGQSALIPPGTEFRIQNYNSLTTASVQYFVPEIDSTVYKSLNRFHSIFHHIESNENTINNHIQELMSIYDDNNAISRKQELLLELIVEKFVSERTNDNRTNILRVELKNRYLAHLERAPSIEDIAQWAGYSPSRFRVLFQRETGMAPIRFFLDLRMEKAAQTLTETVTPIKEIASQCGYSEVSHFNRAFSRHYGISPGRYRRRNTFFG